MFKYILTFIIPTLLMVGCASSGEQTSIMKDSELISSETTDGKDREADNTESTELDEITDSGDTSAPTVEESQLKTKLPVEAIFEALVITSSGLDLYEQPTTQSNKIDTLLFGAHVFAVDTEGDWVFVHYRGTEGWVSQSRIQEIPYDSSEKQEIEDPDDLLVLVNKQYVLPDDYKPEDLVVVDVPFSFEGESESKYLRKEAATALEEMFEQSKQEGINLVAASGFRSFAKQRQLFCSNILRVGYDQANDFSAFPGESEHQTGLAMDLTSRKVSFALTTDFENTQEGIWIKENAHKYGYIIRYLEGKENITRYTFEPWHLRYVGKEPAKVIYELGITLEEYLSKVAN
ncbi:MAG: D-alanyl-D-alanine carboxypeptidase family protein [Anaerobacillus sp.]|uniref:D-alanyl-D-alanine carboxypeptidase family protein n=1 Tax=Anaerobacillus sp. TaxID=1872506 RepID=UPI00391DE150